MKVFKKILSIALLLTIIVTSLSVIGCNKDDTEEKEGFGLSETAITMYVFESKALTLNTDSDEQINWTCTADGIVELTPNGKAVEIKGIRRGEISVVATQGNNSVSCTVNVFPTSSEFKVEVTSAKTLQLLVGESYQLSAKAYVDGEEFTGATFEYKIVQASPEGCVTLSETGLATAVAQGTVILSVRAKFGDTYTEWEEATLYVFKDGYNNDNQEQPDGFIPDVFEA